MVFENFPIQSRTFLDHECMLAHVTIDHAFRFQSYVDRVRVSTKLPSHTVQPLWNHPFSNSFWQRFDRVYEVSRDAICTFHVWIVFSNQGVAIARCHAHVSWPSDTSMAHRCQYAIRPSWCAPCPVIIGPGDTVSWSGPVIIAPGEVRTRWWRHVRVDATIHHLASMRSIFQVAFFGDIRGWEKFERVSLCWNRP